MAFHMLVKTLTRNHFIADFTHSLQTLFGMGTLPWVNAPVAFQMLSQVMFSCKFLLAKMAFKVFLTSVHSFVKFQFISTWKRFITSLASMLDVTVLFKTSSPPESFFTYFTRKLCPILLKLSMNDWFMNLLFVYNFVFFKAGKGECFTAYLALEKFIMIVNVTLLMLF